MLLGEYILGSELIEKWPLQPFELIDLCQAGIQPYDDTGQPIIIITIDQLRLFESYTSGRAGGLKYVNRSKRLKSVCRLKAAIS